MRNRTTEILGNVVTHKKGFAFKSEWFQDSGVPIVKVTNFTESSVDTSDLDYVSEGIAEEKKNYSLSKDDVIIQTVGSWPNNPASVVGKVIKIPKDIDNALLNQNAVVLYPRAKVYKGYLFFLLKDRSFKGYIINTAQGAANQASITLDSIFRFQFYLPHFETQKKIAAILTTYDDLIENNKRRIALLQKMAEEIYREWFVRMRFPGHEKLKFEKGVPEGWNILTIADISDQIRKGIKKKNLSAELKYIGLEHIPRKSISITDSTTADSVLSDKLLFKERDILFGKIRPYLHKVAIASFSGVCSSDTIVIRPKQSKYEGFLLFTIFSETFIELASIASKGTKMPRADWDFLKKLELKVPDDNLLELFQNKFSDIFLQLANLIESNQLLAMSRDKLLNRLISGKLPVEDLNIQFPPSMLDEAEDNQPVDAEKDAAYA